MGSRIIPAAAPVHWPATALSHSLHHSLRPQPCLVRAKPSGIVEVSGQWWPDLQCAEFWVEGSVKQPAAAMFAQ